MAMEPGPGATDDSETNKLSSRTPEPDPKSLLSSTLIPNTNSTKTMRLWAFSAYTRSVKEPVEGNVGERKKGESNPINNQIREDNFEAVNDTTDESETSSDSSGEEYPEDFGYWDPRTNTYKSKRTHEPIPEAEIDDTDDESEASSGSPDEEYPEDFCYVDPRTDTYKSKRTHEPIQEAEIDDTDDESDASSDSSDEEYPVTGTLVQIHTGVREHISLSQRQRLTLPMMIVKPAVTLQRQRLMLKMTKVKPAATLQMKSTQRISATGIPVQIHTGEKVQVR